MKFKILLTLLLSMNISTTLAQYTDYPAPYLANFLSDPALPGIGESFPYDQVTEKLGGDWKAKGRWKIGYTTNDGPYAEPVGVSSRTTEINLQAQGFDDDLMDRQPPISYSIIFEDLPCSNSVFVEINLLDANRNVIFTSHNSMDKLGCKNGYSRHQGDRDQFSQEITNYGRGVRYITWKDGRSDSYGSVSFLKPYLFISPVNIGGNASWEYGSQGAHTIDELDGAPVARTSYIPMKRTKTINLLTEGYSAASLDSGQMPIIVEARYGKTYCPDHYYLNIELLNAKKEAIETYKSGTKTHKDSCVWGDYTEELHHVFTKYDSGVRYIKIEQGGESGEHWAGNYGAVFYEPQVSILNIGSVTNGYHSRVKRSILSNHPWLTSIGSGILASAVCAVSIGTACAAAVTGALAISEYSIHTYDGGAITQSSFNKVAPNHELHRASPNCDQECLFNKVIANLDSAQKKSTWDVTKSSSIEILSTPRKDGKNEADRFLKAVTDAIAGGNTYIDITTLATINGKWVDELADALKKSEYAIASHSENNLIVRIYIGLPGIFTGTSDYLTSAIIRVLNKLKLSHVTPDLGIAEQHWDTHLEGLLQKLTAKLSGTTNMKVYIAGGRSPVDYNWNHSKIVAVDGEVAITGGNNLWGEYFGNEPVLDTSVKVHNRAALHAHKFADLIWTDHYEAHGKKDKNHILKWEKKTITTSGLKLPPAAKDMSVFHSSGQIDVLSVGQLGASTELSSSQVKKAVSGLIDAAHKSIYISQQALIHPYVKNVVISNLYDTIDKDLMGKIARKAISGLDVKIILSNENAPHDTTSNMDNKMLLSNIWKAAVSTGVSDTPNNRKNFCSHLNIGNIRIDNHSTTYLNSTKSFANHSKTIMVDNSIFMIGSHNLYAQSPVQLTEYAYIIANTGEALKFYDQYWNPVLNNSRKTFVTAAECNSKLLNRSGL